MTEYKIKNLTPKKMQCGYAAICPAIYEITPKDMKCGPALGCNGIYENKEESKYLIIGKIADAKKFGLEKKVGKDEILIEVDKRLIDEKGK
ncbi:MAG: hypothetical protein Q8O84_04555 [Nanoarchaeota archaeon]|nr:hypothetical protein [Nanoarchaeota archaeon]